MELKKFATPSKQMTTAVSGASWLLFKEYTTEASTTIGTRKRLNEIMQSDIKSAQRRVGKCLAANLLTHKSIVNRLALLMCMSQVLNHRINWRLKQTLLSRFYRRTRFRCWARRGEYFATLYLSKQEKSGRVVELVGNFTQPPWKVCLFLKNK